MLPAIETPAEQRTAVVNRASRSALIHALTIGFGGKQKYWLSRRRIRKGTMPVLLHIVTLFGMQEEALITSTALGAIAAWHISLSVWQQGPL